MKAYVGILFSILFAYVAATVVAQWIIDPDDAHPETHIEAFAPYRNGGSARRAKARRLEVREYDEFFVGSSRTATTFDSTSFATDDVAYYNLGLTSSSIHEMAAVIDRMLERQNPDSVWIEMSLHLFNGNRRRYRPFNESPFNPHRSIDVRMTEVFAWKDTARAVELVLRYFRDQPVKPRILADGRIYSGRPDRRLARFRTDIGKLMASDIWFSDFEVDEEYLAQLRSMVAALVDSESRVVLFFPPVHSTVLDAMEVAGVYDDYLELIELVVSEMDDVPEVQVWDFSGYRTVQTEPVDLGEATSTKYIDPSHFTVEVATCMYRVVRGDEDLPEWCDDLGTQLTVANLEPHFADLAERKESARTDDPSQLEWVKEVAHARGVSVASSAR